MEFRGPTALVNLHGCRSAQPHALFAFNFPLCVRGVLTPRVGLAAELYFSLSLPLCEPGWLP
jgi:hypothetical protein